MPFTSYSRRVSRAWNDLIDPYLAALEDARPACYWLDRPERPEPTSALAKDAEADLAIVGGGFTGLWAALIAAEESPGRDIVLLEASRIGEGASGRNGGFADPCLTHGLDNGLMHFPKEMAQLSEFGDRNFQELLESLDRHAIDARYEHVGKVDVATAPYQVQELREHVEVIEGFGSKAVWLDRDAVRAELDSPTYLGGLWTKSGGGGVLDPAPTDPPPDRSAEDDPGDARGTQGAAHRCP